MGLSLEGGVRLDDAAGTSGDLWLQEVTSQLPAFRYMMPETAALLRDRLRPETAMLVARIEQNLPTWYASFSEAILGAEHSMNHPSDAFEVFWPGRGSSTSPRIASSGGSTCRGWTPATCST